MRMLCHFLYQTTTERPRNRARIQWVEDVAVTEWFENAADVGPASLARSNAPRLVINDPGAFHSSHPLPRSSRSTPSRVWTKIRLLEQTRRAQQHGHDEIADASHDGWQPE
jgi:hypothetical protein